MEIENYISFLTKILNFSDLIDDGVANGDCRWSRFVRKDKFTFTHVDFEVSGSAECMKINDQD